MNTAFIALGSNLDSPIQQIQSALKSLHTLGDVTGISSWYQSEAIGPTQQDFLNGAVRLETPLPPLELLEALQQIEWDHHRKRITRWGPRSLDLDILLFNALSYYSKRLEIPHPRTTERAFVLLPLLDIDETLSLPGGEKISSFLPKVAYQSLNRLDSINDYR
ncbi:MAG: 2-amino-4-hydroxy-6-hydroxymethyldihydropteridine diphosphokinase [Cellvibrionales bacterium]|nr:2-amino-4-hydroxy-6-hydroxymethyldihydropteridine diphosphokinase [Cellvibrionales bacterium]